MARKKIKVAINSGPLRSGHAVRGIGVHTRELVETFKDLSSEKIKVDAIDFQGKDLSKYDVVNYSFFNPFFYSLPFTKTAKKVVLTIHDLIPLVYPENYPPGIKGKIRFFFQKLLVRKNVDSIVTISETSKKDIVKFMGVDRKMVNVIHLAPGGIFKEIKDKEKLEKVREKYDLPKKFVLYVGDINYNKNIPNLIKAAKKADLALVICGKQAMDIENLGKGLDVLSGPQDWVRFLFDIPHPELAHYEKVLDEFRRSKKIYRLGFIPDEDLVSVYNLATVYCQPSFYEGFGLPVLEAMASGTPVVASKIAAHEEIAKDSVLYTNPKSANDISKKLKKMYKDESLREKYKKLGLKKVKEFSWEKTAKKTLEVYKKVSDE